MEKKAIIKKNAFMRNETAKKIVFHNNAQIVPDNNVIDLSEGNNGSVIAWYTDPTTLHVASLYGDKISANEDSSYMFAECYSLSEIDGLRNLDTSNVKTMRGMFMHCISLTELDVSSFDTSNVRDMSYMFDTCTKIQKLDLSNFDTSKVEKLFGMFDWCVNLTDLDLSSFNPTMVKYGDDTMFYQCDIQHIKYRE